MSAVQVLATGAVSDTVATTRAALVGAAGTIADLVPRIVVFLLILIIGLIVAKVLSRAADKILERVGFDRAVERGGIKRALARSKYDASDLLAKFVYYALVLFVLQLAFGVFGNNPISDLLTQVIAFIPRVIVAIIIVVIAAAIASGVRSLIENTLGGLSYGRVLARIASVFILGLGIIAALNQVGIATTVTTPVLIAVLGTLAGVIIVGVGGGLIRPMQARWESYLTRAEAEAPRIAAQTQSSSSGTAEQDRYSDIRPGSTPVTGATTTRDGGTGARRL